MRLPPLPIANLTPLDTRGEYNRVNEIAKEGAATLVRVAAQNAAMEKEIQYNNTVADAGGELKQLDVRIAESPYFMVSELQAQGIEVDESETYEIEGTGRVVAPGKYIANYHKAASDEIIRRYTNQDYGWRHTYEQARGTLETQYQNPGSAKAVEVQYKKLSQELQTSTTSAVEVAIKTGNPVELSEVLNRGLERGLDPVWASEMFIQGVDQIHVDNYFTDIGTSVEESYLDLIQDRLTSDTEISVEARRQVQGDINRQRGILKGYDQERYNTNFTELEGMAVAGTLTDDIIVGRYQHDEIARPEVTQLRALMRSNAGSPGNDKTMQQSLEAKIRNSYGTILEEATTDMRKVQIENQLYQLRGEGIIDNETYNAAMAFNQTTYDKTITNSVATNYKRQMAAAVGADPSIVEAGIVGNTAQSRAFYRFLGDFDDYMADAGTDANPREFIEKNKDRYSNVGGILKDKDGNYLPATFVAFTSKLYVPKETQFYQHQPGLKDIAIDLGTPYAGPITLASAIKAGDHEMSYQIMATFANENNLTDVQAQAMLDDYQWNIMEEGIGVPIEVLMGLEPATEFSLFLKMDGSDR